MSKEISMDKKTISKAFNNLFFDFLDDVLVVFPESKEILHAKKSFGLLRTANPTILIKAWKTHVYDKYQKYIDAGDISFFFEKDYSDDLQNVRGGDDIIKMIDNIRAPLSLMDENNKKHCAEYVLKLSKLSVMYQDIIKG
jgi:hypothetical protein